MFADRLFEDKIALVTGGRSGIGFSIAKQLLKLGAKVIICSRNKEKLETATNELKKIGECNCHPLDIRSREQISDLSAFIKENYGRLDFLINNAGGQFPSPAEAISHNGWNAVINNNLNGTWYMTQQIANDFFLPSKKGKIINIIANIFRGFPGMIHTGAARAGIDNLTKTLAVEWSRKGIHINAVAPGIINSTGLEQYPESLLEGIAQKIPLKRLGTCDEVAYMVLFLLSPMADFISGETIYVDGAQHLWGDMYEL